MLAVSIGELIPAPLLVALCKPLSMPLLGIALWRTGRLSKRISKLFLIALGFAWIGDILLLFAPDPHGPEALLGVKRDLTFFLAGVGSFLGTQVLYVITFIHAPKHWPVGAPKWAYGVILLYGAGMLGYLWHALGHPPDKAVLRLPVLLYGLTLLSMLGSALTRKGHVPKKSFWAVLIGAVCFVVSDTLIALNLLAWAEPLPGAGSLIFLLYGVAQYLIGVGLCQESEGT
ncbi:MAG: lysoplasmalogenase [Bacteroidia bacterium]|nr:lysoplasmalogenase [Bacteroidia bacterium]